MKTFFRKRSLHLCLINTGGCNGCDVEVLSCLAPRYDLEQYGIYFHNNPREADILVVSGPVTLQWKEKIKELYEKVPEPKIVIALGACALSGGIFKEGHTCKGVLNILPVDAKVPGCPPKPAEIIKAILKVAPKLIAEREKKCLQSQ
ncbi:NADH-quinone oxidoreductase subunit B family protein [Methanocaldococcus infernus]